MAQAYYSPMTVQTGQVPSTQTDFPKLSLPTDNRFRTIANGGHVANANGFDIRPYADSALTTPLTYELVYYNATTGQFEMHVKIPSLADGYVTYFGYGDTSLTTDGSSTATWSNSFKSVYHLKDGTTLNVNDSVGSFNGTNVNTVTAGAGKIDGCGVFASASSQRVNTGDQRSAAITISGWGKATSFPNAYNCVWGFNNASISEFAVLLVKSTGKLTCSVFANAGVAYDGTGTNTLSTGTWYLLSLTYDSSAGLKGYVNGSVDGSAAANGNLVTSQSAASSIGSNYNGSVAQHFWNGSLDEIRVATVARSANWLATEYNNQNAPGTFETLGSEVQLATSTGNMFLLFP